MGGGSIPASGFALYLDRLMNLVKPQSPPKPPNQRILLRAESGEAKALQEASSIASSLREAGYVVELNLGGEELADFRWLLDVRKGPLFVLTDQVKPRRFELKNADEALVILGEEGGDKTSLT